MPAVPARAVQDDPDGINAVLLGPPGSGKGTQVRNTGVSYRSLPVREARAVSGNAGSPGQCYPLQQPSNWHMHFL